MTSVSVTAGQITRTYLLRGDGGKITTLQACVRYALHVSMAASLTNCVFHFLQLSHNTVSGDRVIAIDGVEVAVSIPRNEIMMRALTLDKYFLRRRALPGALL